MKKILFSLLILSLYAQESSDSSDDEGAEASTSAQAASRRRHRCPVEGCGRSFMRSAHFKNHERTHTGERPYSCIQPGCGKSFTQSGNLGAHMRLHARERPHACTQPGCDKSFTLKNHLADHMRIHIGEKPYSCNICEKSFSRSSILNAHMRTLAHRDRELAQNVSPDTSSYETSESVSPELPHAAEAPQQQSSLEEDFDPAIYLNLEEDEEEPSPKRHRLEKDNV